MKNNRAAVGKFQPPRFCASTPRPPHPPRRDNACVVHDGTRPTMWFFVPPKEFIRTYETNISNRIIMVA